MGYFSSLEDGLRLSVPTLTPRDLSLSEIEGMVYLKPRRVRSRHRKKLVNIHQKRSKPLSWSNSMSASVSCLPPNPFSPAGPTHEGQPSTH